MTSSLNTRPSLLVRIRKVEDAEAWQTFVSLYAPLVFNYSRRRGVQDADATDLTQEVMKEVMKSIRAFDYQPEKGRFRDWFGTVVRRELGRFWEKQKRTGKPGSAETMAELPAGRVDTAWDEEAHAQILRVALARIRPHFEPVTWQAFTCTWLENRPAAETADALGLPIETVYVAKSRVLKRLEEEVLDLAEDVPQPAAGPR
ncbi:sigma-70 family RNA polymerase sigma factor [soil metagenome]